MLFDVRYYGRWILLGTAIMLVSFVFLQGTSFMFIPFVLFITPLMYAFYLKNKVVKELEENFRVFLDDLKDLLQGGVTISDALVITSRNDYGPLSVYVKRLAAKVRIGIPFEKAMTVTFANTNSPLIKKIILVINQTLRAGGNFMRVFAVAIDYVDKVEKLKSQRKSRTTSAIINSYLMFYVFVLIIVLMHIFFLPMLTQQMSINMGQLLEGGFDVTGQPIPSETQTSQPPIDYKWHFTNLIIIQAIFAGPMIGKISEDSFVAGLKHSAILLLTSLVLYFSAISIMAPK